MADTTGISFDVSSALSLGARTRQEDALVTSFAQGSEIGFAILSDGMGGHTAGDLASRIIVTEMFAELTLRTATGQLEDDDFPSLLRYAAEVANECLASHIEANPQTQGMGGTVVATLTVGRDLYWLSIGDSPLWLLRDGEFRRLNADHSMAPQIDLMVAQGMMDEATGRAHPQRNCLTSAIIGQTLAEIDCPEEPFQMEPGDLLLAASDGLQYLPDAGIEAILKRGQRDDSRTLADALLSGVASVEDPEQDNTSVVVIRAEAIPESTPQTTGEFSVGNMLKSILRNVTPARAAGTERS